MAKSLQILGLVVLICFPACYQFEPFDESLSLSPSLAFPVAMVNQNIEGSLVLIGNPEINLQEEVPHWAKYREVFLIDTISFALADLYQQTEQIRYLAFRLTTWNDFPSSATAQIVFLDQNSVPIDSLFAPIPFGVASSQTSSSGAVIKRGLSQTEIALTTVRIENLRQAKRIAIRCSASNVGVPTASFQYYLNYYLSAKLSARIGLSIQI